MGYGIMVSGRSAVEWMKTKGWAAIQDAEKTNHEFASMWSRCMNRFQYEIDKATPVPVKVRKGRREDYSCGNCGHVVDYCDKYCANCGTAINWVDRKVIELQ